MTDPESLRAALEVVYAGCDWVDNRAVDDLLERLLPARDPDHTTDQE